MFFNDFGRYFHMFTLLGHWQNPWLALMEALCSVEAQLKTTGLVASVSG